MPKRLVPARLDYTSYVVPPIALHKYRFFTLLRKEVGDGRSFHSACAGFGGLFIGGPDSERAHAAWQMGEDGQPGFFRSLREVR